MTPVFAICQRQSAHTRIGLGSVGRRWRREKAGGMANTTDTPVSTGAELALADALVLVIDVLTLHGIMKSEGLDSIFVFLEQRYRESGLVSSAGMARYLREHLSHPEQSAARARLCDLVGAPPQGSA
jgi:hypothetical protein